jgi:hypothetical protein
MVEIRGGGTLDGAILDDAATETTLRRLVGILQSQGDKASADKVEKMGNQAAQMSTEQIAANTKSFKSLQDQTDDLHNKSLKPANEKFAELNKTLGSTAATLASRGITSIFDFFATGLDSFRNLSGVGVTFNGDLREMSSIALNAGKSVGDFAKQVAENSQSLVALGGSADGGARKFAEIAGILNKDLIGRFTALGMTLGNVDDVTKSYLDSASRLGTLTRQNSNSIAENTAKFAESIDEISKSTGMNREQLARSAAEIARDPMWNAFLRSLPSGQMEQAKNNLAAIGGISKNLENSFKDLAAGVGPKSPMSILLQQDTQARQISEKVLKGQMSVSDALPGLAAASDRLMRQFGNEAGAIAASNAGNTLATAALELKNGLSLYENVQKDASKRSTDKQLAAYDSLGSNLGKLSASLTTSWQRLIGAFVNTTIFEKFNNALTEVVSFLNSGKGISALGEMGEQIASAFGRLLETIKAGYQSGGIWGAIVAGLSGLWNQILPAFNTEIQKLIGKIFPGMSPSEPASQRARANDLNQDQRMQFDTMKDFWNATFEQKMQFLQQEGMNFFKNLPTAITTGIGSARSQLNELFGDVDGFLSGLPERLAVVSKAVTDAISNLPETFKTIKSTIVEASDKLAVLMATNNLTGATDNMAANIKKTLDSVRELLGADLATLTNSDGFKSMISTTSQFVNNLSTNIDNAKKSLKGFADTATEEFNKFALMFKPSGNISSSIQDFSTTLAGLTGPIGTVIRTLSGENGETAQALGVSVVNSLTNFMGSVTQAIAAINGIDTSEVPKKMEALTSMFSTLRNIAPVTVGGVIGAIMPEIKMPNMAPIVAFLNDLQSYNVMSEEKVQGIITNLRSLVSGLSNLRIPDIDTSKIANLQSIKIFLDNFQSINVMSEEKVQGIIGNLRSLVSGLSSFRVPEGFFSDSEAVGRIVGNINRFQNINTETINGVVTSMRSLQGIGSVLSSDIQGVRTFTENVGQLRAQLEASASAAERLKAAATSIPAGAFGGGVGGGSGSDNTRLEGAIMNLDSTSKGTNAILDDIRTVLRGGQAGPALPSDVRLKQDIRYISKLQDGINLYSYSYKNDTSRKMYVGVMAQEVIRVVPNAVITMANGFMAVRYDLLGIKLMTLKKWNFLNSIRNTISNMQIMENMFVLEEIL